MKLAISADGPTLESHVTHRLSAATYLLIVDVDTGAFEAVPTVIGTNQRGAGVQIIVTAVNKGAGAIVTGYCGAGIAGQLKDSGIEIVTGIKGTAQEALDQYRTGTANEALREDQHRASSQMQRTGGVIQAMKSSCRQFAMLLPVLLGVVLLIGLFNASVSKEVLMSIFSGNAALDSLWGACCGSLFAGNPINSYIIGGELLRYDISLFAVTAFIVSWVTVGLVQLPAEMAAFGRKFALLRNALCFVMAIPVAILTVVIVHAIERWLS